MEKEEYAVVLDYLPYGYPLEGKTMPVAQAIGVKTLVLLQLVPRKGMTLETKEKVYIGEGKREKIYYILGRLDKEKLTESAKLQIEDFAKIAVEEKEKEFVDFFNKADAINTRIHQIELIPGFGKKHTQEILKAREEKPFESFEDMKQRLPHIPDPKKSIEKRLVEELTQEQRHNLFAR